MTAGLEVLFHHRLGAMRMAGPMIGPDTGLSYERATLSFDDAGIGLIS